MAYYLAHVDDDTEDCVLWPYATTFGYGVLYVSGHLQRVHVLACVRHHGPPPEGMRALHAAVICHNPTCFNWRHLRWGTVKENSADMLLDGTDATGERSWDARLTWDQVTEIRARYAAGGITQTALAAEYGVSFQHLSLIVKGRRWPNR